MSDSNFRFMVVLLVALVIAAGFTLGRGCTWWDPASEEDALHKMGFTDIQYVKYSWTGYYLFSARNPQNEIVEVYVSCHPVGPCSVKF